MTAGACGAAFAIASGALKGALIGAATGAVGGGMKSAMDYYEEHGTIDGSGSQILAGAAEGFATGAISGAASGAMAGAAKYAKNPSGYCFIAGTLVLTAVGLTNIENIQAGDLVYAKEAVEQSVDVSQDVELAPVLEVYAHEVDETYVVTVDGESIETTANHPFYDENGEQVEAKDLEEGDELTTANGDTATVDSVECIHHDEPVMVYNFCVMEDHTYFVGEHGVLVHNECDKSALNSIEKKLRERKAGQYNTFYEHTLDKSEYLKSDGVQFRKANKALLQSMEDNPSLKKKLLSAHPEEFGEWLNNPNTSVSPGGFTWHHFEDEGVLKLVDRLDHRNNFSIYHPTGRGGREIWGGGKLGRMGKL